MPRSLPSRTGRTPRDEGFTLLEVLVALAILGVSFATLLGIFGQSLDRDHAIAQRIAARALAQSLLAQAEIDPNIVPGTRTGRDGADMDWRVTTMPVLSQDNGLSLAQITVAVRWRSESAHALRLTTLRVLPKDTAS